MLCGTCAVVCMWNVDSERTGREVSYGGGDVVFEESAGSVMD